MLSALLQIQPLPILATTPLGKQAAQLGHGLCSPILHGTHTPQHKLQWASQAHQDLWRQQTPSSLLATIEDTTAAAPNASRSDRSNPQLIIDQGRTVFNGEPTPTVAIYADPALTHPSYKPHDAPYTPLKMRAIVHRDTIKAYKKTPFLFANHVAVAFALHLIEHIAAYNNVDPKSSPEQRNLKTWATSAFAKIVLASPVEEHSTLCDMALAHHGSLYIPAGHAHPIIVLNPSIEEPATSTCRLV